MLKCAYIHDTNILIPGIFNDYCLLLIQNTCKSLCFDQSTFSPLRLMDGLVICEVICKRS